MAQTASVLECIQAYSLVYTLAIGKVHNACKCRHKALTKPVGSEGRYRLISNPSVRVIPVWLLEDAIDFKVLHSSCSMVDAVSHDDGLRSRRNKGIRALMDRIRIELSDVGLIKVAM